MTLLPAETPMREVRGACPHNCPDTCGWIVTLDDDGRPSRISGNPDHPYTGGWLCAKVNRYLELVHHPDRLTTPLRRTGPRGSDQWRPITWDEAVAEIVNRWGELIATQGPEAILPYSYSGTLGFVQGEVCNQRLWTRMGASGLARTICSVAGTEAARVTVGGSFGVDPESVPKSRLILLWGTNPASTHPHFIPWLDKARRNGARVYLIDPHRSLTAQRADVVIQPRPGSDAALALALMHVLLTENLDDRDWAERHTVGLAELRQRALEMPPERASALTGVPADQIRTLAREYGTTRPALIKCSMGLQRHSNGGNTVRCLACLPALTGDYGRPGGGFLYSTGGYLPWPAQVACPPGLREASPNPRPRVMNMNRLGAALLEARPPISALYVFNSNPAAVAPNSARVLEGLSRPDLFTVVHDIFMTDTALMADIVLPATTQFEHWDIHRAYGHLYVQLNQPAMAPLGQAKENWEVMRLLARGMGFRDAAFDQDARQIIRALIDQAGQALEGVTFEGLVETGWARLNFPRPFTPFAGGRFPTPSGKVELYSRQLADLGEDPLPHWEPDRESREANPAAEAYPLQLVSAASHYFLNSSFANLPTLRRLAGEPSIEIHRDDAESRGIAQGDLLEVYNSRGSFQARARLGETVQPGTLFCPTVWWNRNSPDGRGANWTTSDELADYAGGATFHGNLVEVRPVPTAALQVNQLPAILEAAQS